MKIGLGIDSALIYSKVEADLTETLTVNLPSELYVRIKKRAEEARRSVEDEAIELLAATIPVEDEIGQCSKALELLDESALLRAARSALAVDLAAELEALHFKQQREGLTESEAERCAELVRAYERSMLVRANAAAILKKRGVDVTCLSVQP